MRLVPTILGAAFLAALTPIAFSQQFTGSIQTTKIDATTVNSNLFQAKEDVYLKGGPQNSNPTGLPNALAVNGLYYFQVTNPSGTVLLSNDLLNCRIVKVENGVITRSYDSVTNTWDGDRSVPGACSHALGNLNPDNGQRPVQLWPYDNTPNNGGVYKLWLFSIDPAIGCADTHVGDGGLIVAAGGCTKTDNFKVRLPGCTVDCGTPPASTITGLKYNDTDASGTRELLTDPPLANWQIDVTGTKLGAPFGTSVFTDAFGLWSVPDLDEGTQFTACEVLTTQLGWIQSGPKLTDTIPNTVIGVVNNPTSNTTYGPRCWQGTIPVSDVSNLNFGNYAQLVVSKTANAGFKRTYNWTIAKAVDKTKVSQVGGSAIFNYTVTATETGFTDSDWVVTGTISVQNLNAGTVGNITVTDAIGLQSCTVQNAGAISQILSGATANLTYSCPLAGANNGTNIATATWIGGSPTGSAGYTFGNPTSTVNKTINVTDNFNGAGNTSLGTATATDTTPYTSKEFKYSRTINIPAFGCLDYSNTATITETGATAGQKVTVCGPVKTGALTMGFWQNKNGQAIITNGAVTSGVCKSGTFLRTYAPFQDLSATATCNQVATYVTNIIKAASAAGAAMNAMLKAQDLATSLDVYFGGGGGGNQIGAPVPVGGVTIDLTKVCKNIPTCTIYENVSSAFGGATSLTISQMLDYAALQSNAGGSVWYGQLKTVQELAKDAFDAINNQVALAP